MSPSAPTPPPSGKPTVKQQRAAQRAEKLEAFKKQQARTKRNRRIATAGILLGTVAVIALIIAIIVANATPRVSYTAGGSGATIEGVEVFQNPTSHVEGPVTYPQTPPAGGEHHPAWLNCGVYSEQVPNENAVHSLEHGAIWITYDPAMAEGDVNALKALMPPRHAILSPFEGIPSPVVVSAWNAQLKAESPDDPRIGEFIEEYWLNDAVPEPGAQCTGAIDGPGKVS